MPKVKPSRSSKSLRARSANNTHQGVQPVRSWQANLTQYTDQRLLTFKSTKDLDAAIDMLWTAELRGLPHETPDGKTLVIPAEAVDYFTRAGLRFTAKQVLSVSDLSAEEIRRLRR